MMKSQNSAIGRSHVVWLDVVRFVAMFTVVCCHSADPFNFYPGEPPANIDQIKFWGAAYGSFLRPCVPLFVMITGALLLPLKDDTSVFYKKRISRVFWPFLIWSVLYNLFPWITGQLGILKLKSPFIHYFNVQYHFSNNTQFIRYSSSTLKIIIG